jgi:hypothetical protein
MREEEKVCVLLRRGERKVGSVVAEVDESAQRDDRRKRERGVANVTDRIQFLARILDIGQPM